MQVTLMTESEFNGLMTILRKRKRFYYSFRYTLKYMLSKNIPSEENIKRFVSLGATNDLEILEHVTCNLWIKGESNDVRD